MPESADPIFTPHPAKDLGFFVHEPSELRVGSQLVKANDKQPLVIDAIPALPIDLPSDPCLVEEVRRPVVVIFDGFTGLGWVLDLFVEKHHSEVEDFGLLLL